MHIFSHFEDLKSQHDKFSQKKKLLLIPELDKLDSKESEIILNAYRLF
jgi:hypothetical protein